MQQYLARKQKEQEDTDLANRIIEGIKQELNSVKDQILQKLDHLRKEELQGLVKGYLYNFELYRAGMPNELYWSQNLLMDANNIGGQLYFMLRRYMDESDLQSSNECFAMYAPLISTHIHICSA